MCTSVFYNYVNFRQTNFDLLNGMDKGLIPVAFDVLVAPNVARFCMPSELRAAPVIGCQIIEII